MVPSHSIDGTRDRGEIRVGAYPERIVGKDPLIDVSMMKPDTQRVQALLGKAMLRWEQTDRRLSKILISEGREDVQDVERELPRVEREFEGDGFANVPMHAACLVR